MHPSDQALVARIRNGETSAFEEDIPDIDMIKGTYRVRSIITMHNGLTKVAPDEYEVTVR